MVWKELWDELYHQYPSDVACAAVPELAAIAADGAPSDRFEAVQLAGALLAKADPYTAEIRERYAGHIATLLREAQVELAENSPEDNHDPTSFVLRVQAVLAFEDATIWSEQLIGLLDEEFEIICPACWAAMDLYLGERGFFTCTGGYPPETVTRRPLVASHPDELTGLGHRLHRLAAAARQHTLARQLTYLFGRGTCTENGHQFIPADSVVELWTS